MRRRTQPPERTPEYVNRKVASYLKNGWAPVEWAHHPPVVKAAIRAAGFRPGVKECYANTQWLVMGQDVEQFTYCEGIVASNGLPIQHAWLLLGGPDSQTRVDLTLPHAPAVLAGYSVPADDLRVAMLKTGTYGPVHPDRLSWILGAAIWGAQVGDVSSLDEAALKRYCAEQVAAQRSQARMNLMA